MSGKILISCVALALLSSGMQVSCGESFLAQPTAKVVKKHKRSLATMRNELVEAFEDYAHALVEELAYLSLCMRSGCNDTKIIAEFQKQYDDLQQAIHFFTEFTVDYTRCKKETDKDHVMQFAWILAGKIAHVQEQLLVAMRQVLEQDPKSGFMRAEKDEVAQFIQFIHTHMRKSEDFTHYLQNLTHKARLKK